MTRPLLLLDVDGPLNPFRARPNKQPRGYTTHRMKPDSWVTQHEPMPAARVKPLRVWLNPDHGPALLDLPYELVWATTWAGDANGWIAPVLGLPELPFVEWPEKRSAAGRLHWKTPTLLEYAAGRPFAWVDDEITRWDREWVAERYPAQTLLLAIDPGRGLCEEDFETLADWAEAPW